jgi:N-acetylglucosamine-6-phosphate deacetylase
VPDDLVRQVSLIGPRGYVKERIAAFAEAGVTTLLATPVTADSAEYITYVEALQQLLP